MLLGPPECHGQNRGKGMRPWVTAPFSFPRCPCPADACPASARPALWECAPTRPPGRGESPDASARPVGSAALAAPSRRSPRVTRCDTVTPVLRCRPEGASPEKSPLPCDLKGSSVPGVLCTAAWRRTRSRHGQRPLITCIRRPRGHVHSRTGPAPVCWVAPTDNLSAGGQEADPPPRVLLRLVWRCCCSWGACPVEGQTQRRPRDLSHSLPPPT